MQKEHSYPCLIQHALKLNIISEYCGKKVFINIANTIQQILMETDFKNIEKGGHNLWK